MSATALAAPSRKRAVIPGLVVASLSWIALILMIAVLADMIRPFGITAMDLRARLTPPIGFGGNARHFLGTDELGRDVASRLFVSIRISLLIAFGATIIAAFVGTMLGFLAAHFRGWVEQAVLMLIDFQASMPFLILALSVLAFFGNSLPLFVCLMGLYGWERHARIARGLAIAANAQGYAAAVRQLGARPLRIYLAHVLPNIAATLIVAATLSFPEVVLLESGLSFLGLGVQPPMTSLGNMVGYGREYLHPRPVDPAGAEHGDRAHHPLRQPARRLAARPAGPDTFLKDAYMTLIASHRGGSLQWPENSPTAFRNSADLPVDQIEFDIHPTADGEIVVIHDATLDRTTSGTGPVAANRLAQLRAVTLNGTEGEHMLTLAELCAVFAPTPITLRMEVKPDPAHRPYPGLVPHALAVLDHAGLRPRSVVTSFQIDTVAEAQAAGGLAGTIWLVSTGVQDDIGADGIAAVCHARRITAVSIRAPRLDGGLLAKLRAQGLGVGAYAVNDEAAIRRVLGLGVDVFTTDLPSLALGIRAKQG